MKNYILECRIPIVSVGSPTVGSDINFHIPGFRKCIPDLDDCTPKIGPTFNAPKPRMQNLYWLFIKRLQIGTNQPLVLPDGLEQILGRGFLVFVKQGCNVPPNPPFGIKVIHNLAPVIHSKFTASACAKLTSRSQALRLFWLDKFT